MSTKPVRNRQAAASETLPDTNDAPTAGYEVGYKRPPIHARFNSGQSGNPRGRPAGRPSMKHSFERMMNQPITLRDGEKIYRTTQWDALVQAHIRKAIKGDPRSAKFVVDFADRMGLLIDPEDESASDQSKMDRDILERAVGRRAGSRKDDNVQGAEKL